MRTLPAATARPFAEKASTQGDYWAIALKRLIACFEKGIAMRHLFRLAVLGSALGLALPAAAQNSTARSDSGDIIVEGKRIEKKEVDQFVRALTDTRPFEQISRFEWEVCPVALGLDPRQAGAIARRIRAVAAAAGAPIAKAGCNPNILVLATQDPQKLIAVLRKKFPYIFRDPIDQPVHISGTGPALAWHVEGALTRDNLPATVANTPTTKYYRSDSTVSSRLTPPIRSHFLLGVLILDSDSLAGLTTTQVADYATMRLLARTDPDNLDRIAVPTILSILEAAPDSRVPVTLTNWDFSYLKALYGSAVHRYASSQQGEMQRLVRKDLQAPEGKR